MEGLYFGRGIVYSHDKKWNKYNQKFLNVLASKDYQEIYNN